MRATTIEGQNAFAPALFHVTEGQNTRDQFTSDRRSKRASDKRAFYAFHTFLVEVQTNAGYIGATHA